MKCPNCEKEIENERANYCGLCSYWLKEPPYKSHMEKLHEEGKHEMTKIIMPLLNGKYNIFEEVRKQYPMQYKQIRESRDLFESGFLFGFYEGIAHRMEGEVKEKESKAGANPPPERDHIEVPKSGKSGFEIVTLYNYPERNHALIRLKKGTIESLGLPYDVPYKKPMLAEVRNGILLLKVIQELIHDDFE